MHACSYIATAVCNLLDCTITFGKTPPVISLSAEEPVHYSKASTEQQVTIKVCHTQTQVSMKPEMHHHGKPIRNLMHGYHTCVYM